MTDYAKLAQELDQRIAEARDLAALEAVRVEALGKTGTISELLKSLGKMTPDERRELGPQINGLRGDTSIAERTSYDLWYIEHWSLWLDIKIILRTLLMVILRKQKNAY